MLYSQTDEERKRIVSTYEQKEIDLLLEKLNLNYENEQKKILDLAKKNNWPLERKGREGQWQKLVRIVNDIPIYYTTYNRGSAITIGVNKLRTGGTLGLELDGQNMTAGIWDGQKPRLTHNDIAGRVSMIINQSDTLDDHPTHVLGTILGTGADVEMAQGMAPKASAIYGDFNNDLAEILVQASQGLLVSNHSYGYDAKELPVSIFGQYDETSKSLDEIHYNAPFYQSVYGAGNDRSDGFNPTKNGYDLLSGHCIAKNVIVVGATVEVIDYDGPSSVFMSYFSNWGPTDDNRIKPDISSKGINVFSATATSDSSHEYFDGTSMATPSITGAILLLQQHYKNNNGGTFMRSSTLRGMVAHTAKEAGPFPGPDAMFGWGLMDAEKAAVAISNNGISSLISELTLLPNQVYEKQVTVLGTEPLIATLSWTDPAGTISTTQDSPTPLLVNDLDIRIVKNGETYFPWKLDNTLAVAAIKGDNIVDNIEKIEVENPNGNYTIRVSHKGNISSPVAAGSPSQNYSLIITGVTNPLSIKDNSFERLVLWPNPVNDLLYVDFKSQNNEKILLEIFDLRGAKLMSNHLGAANETSGSVDVSSLSSGIYMVKITQGDLYSVSKISIN